MSGESGIETPQANRLASGAPGVIQIGERAFVVENAGQDDLTAFGMQAAKINGSRRRKLLMETAKECGDFKLAEAIVNDSEQHEVESIKQLITTESANGKWDDKAMAFYLAAMSPEGAAFLLWLLARKSEPTLQLADVQALVNEANATAISLEIMSAAKLKEIAPN